MDDALEPADNTDEVEERESQFIASWREEMLAKAWEQLKKVEDESGKPLYTTICLRVDRHDLRSPQLAKEL